MRLPAHRSPRGPGGRVLSAVDPAVVTTMVCSSPDVTRVQAPAVGALDQTGDGELHTTHDNLRIRRRQAVPDDCQAHLDGRGGMIRRDTPEILSVLARVRVDYTTVRMLLTSPDGMNLTQGLHRQHSLARDSRPTPDPGALGAETCRAVDKFGNKSRLCGVQHATCGLRAPSVDQYRRRTGVHCGGGSR